MADKPRFSSSAQLAALFSSLIGVAAVFTLYQMFMLGMSSEDGSFLLKITLVLLLFICIGLFTVSHYVTQRLSVISETAQNIMSTGDISQRIPIDRRSDDLMALSSVLNNMLDEIEALVQGIRSVSDNIAHDLRTPLTRLRNHMEKLRESKTLLTKEMHDAQLDLLISECDTLLTTFNALLRIANIESGKRSAAFSHTDLELILSDVVDMYEPIAQAKNVTLHYHSQPATIVGDKDLLFQAFANLIDNAVKFTEPGNDVDIRLYSNAQRIHIEIEDEGPGVAVEHRNKVFQRFYRTDASRNTPGSGLGLSLVKAVLELHKATIGLNTGKKGGLVVCILF